MKRKAGATKQLDSIRKLSESCHGIGAQVIQGVVFYGDPSRTPSDSMSNQLNMARKQSRSSSPAVVLLGEQSGRWSVRSHS